MGQFNALSAENGLMIRAIKMLHTVRVNFAELIYHKGFVLFFKIEITIPQLIVLFNDFVQYVYIEGKSLCTVKLFNQFPADWAPHTILIMKFGNTVGAEGVPTVNQDAWNALTYVVLVAAELADVKPSRFVIQLNNIHFFLFW